MKHCLISFLKLNKNHLIDTLCIHTLMPNRRRYPYLIGWLHSATRSMTNLCICNLCCTLSQIACITQPFQLLGYCVYPTLSYCLLPSSDTIKYPLTERDHVNERISQNPTGRSQGPRGRLMGQVSTEITGLSGLNFCSGYLHRLIKR